MKRPSLLLSLLLAALLGPACATSPASAPPAEGPAHSERAFLWEVKGAQGQGGTVYVVGSIHMARVGELSFPPSMEAAYQLRRSEQPARGLERITAAWMDGDAEGMAAELFQQRGASAAEGEVRVGTSLTERPAR
ncbi:MAG: hypothetical protein JXB05_28830 [Myxococcaceae bacterium]|nr:hypothetical protein [Myxococcaceae bacterium]